MIQQVVAFACLLWYFPCACACLLGYTRLRKWYSHPPAPSKAVGSDLDVLPHITVIRPVKGLDPCLYECLSSTFQQTYPASKLTIYFALEGRGDPAVPVVERVVADYPDFDTRIYFEQEDPRLHQNAKALGPNPKIRQLSRPYREAKSDLVWAIDCNVWIGKGVCGRMVDKLCGYNEETPYKFVHQLPLVVDIPESVASAGGRLLDCETEDDHEVVSTSTHVTETRSGRNSRNNLLSRAGGRLEEMFMSSSHAKFYTAINTVCVAPCIVGKSNMYRLSHLNALTDNKGLDHFSHNICEDHLIGDLLWNQPVPEGVRDAAERDPLMLSKHKGKKWGNHGLVLGDLAIQPMANMSLKEYIARRARWLRVRKYTVLAATLVEPGTESFLDSIYGAYGITTLNWFHIILGIPQTWTAFACVWLLSVSVWAVMDYTQYQLLHSAKSIEINENTPSFAKAAPRRRSKRTYTEWLAAWLGREFLAFPIWFWAVVCGTGVVWRGKKLWVGSDMVVHEVEDYSTNGNTIELSSDGILDRSKARND